MNLNLNKDQLKNLINLAKNEVLDKDNECMKLFEGMQGLWDNDMNLHRIMMSTLAGAGQVSMLQPVGFIPTSKNVTIEGAFKCEDSFTGEIFKKIKKQAMYFGCFVRGSDNYPDLVLEEAAELLKTKTIAIHHDEMDIRFSNIAILMELANKEKFQFDCDNITIYAEATKNGNQPYTRIYVQHRSQTYEGNNYEITKGPYSYDYVYTYLTTAIRSSQSFGNAVGTQFMDIPVGIIETLDTCIHKLYSECLGELTVSQVLQAKNDSLIQTLKDIVDTCVSKFNNNEGAEILTPEERMHSIVYFIREHLQWNRTLTMNGQKVASIGTTDINTSEDNTSIEFTPELATLTKVEDGYRRVKINLRFTHLGESNFIRLMEGEDNLTKLFNFWVLVAFDKDLQGVVHSAREVDKLNRFGRTY